MESHDYEELQNIEEMESSTELFYNDTRWQENAMIYSGKWRDGYRHTAGYSIDLRDDSYGWFMRVITEPEFLGRMKDYDVRAHPENRDKPIMAYLSTHENFKWICEKVRIFSKSLYEKTYIFFFRVEI